MGGDDSGSDAVYDEEMIRRLCVEAATETDPKKSGELIALLRAVLRENTEEVKLRAAYLTRLRAKTTAAAD
jgi:hypothetical protein